MKKFQRNYKCKFEIGYYSGSNPVVQEIIEINYPITLNLQMEANNTSDSNKGVFRFFNLDTDKQTKLWKFEWEIKKYIKMYLYAGYQETMPLVFVGNVDTCSSFRQSGGVDFITEITATNMSQLYRYGFVNATVAEGTTFENLLLTLFNAVPDLKIGSIPPEIPPLKKDTAFIGQPMDLLPREYSKYQIYIDKDVLHVLGERDVIDSEHYVLTSASGMLGSPRVSGQVIEIDMIFEPGLTIGQSVLVLSDTLPQLNGTYKLIGVAHAGVISGRVSDRLITKVILISNENLRRLTATDEDYKITAPGEWMRPVSDRVTSPFGFRKSTNSFHNGIDYGSYMNTSVLATANGKVISTGFNIAGFQGYGKVIYIDHGIKDGIRITSLYAHLNKINVSPGQEVSKGMVIGLTGNTGRSQAPHLHFEIRENNKGVNPVKYVGG